MAVRPRNHRRAILSRRAPMHKLHSSLVNEVHLVVAVVVVQVLVVNVMEIAVRKLCASFR